MNYTMKNVEILGSPFVARRFYFDNGAIPCFIEYRKGLTSIPSKELNSASINTCADLDAALNKCVDDNIFDSIIKDAITKRFPNARKVDLFILNQADKAALDCGEGGELGFATFHIGPSMIQHSADSCFAVNLRMWKGMSSESESELKWTEIDADGKKTQEPMLSFIAHYINYINNANSGNIEYALRNSSTLYK